jgi:hypothetical protein
MKMKISIEMANGENINTENINNQLMWRKPMWLMKISAMKMTKQCGVMKMAEKPANENNVMAKAWHEK